MEPLLGYRTGVIVWLQIQSIHVPFTATVPSTLYKVPRIVYISMNVSSHKLYSINIRKGSLSGLLYHMSKVYVEFIQNLGCLQFINRQSSVYAFP